MDIDNDLVRTLAELAAIAGGYAMRDRTAALIGALEVLRPDSERPHLLQALALMNLRDAAGAERVLREQALRINPRSAMALAYLGLALHQQRRIAERDQALRAALAADDPDADAIQLATHLLETPPG